MRQLCLLIICSLALSQSRAAQTIDLPPFEKIVTGPRIALTLVQGDTEQAQFAFDGIDADRLNYEVKNGTLHIYLDYARNIEKQKKVEGEWGEYKTGIYTGGRVLATVTYRTITKLVTKGEEDIMVDGSLADESFKLKVFGDSRVNLEEVNTNRFKVKMYGDCELTIDSGSAEHQKYTLYGDHFIDIENVKSRKVKSTMFGDTEMRVNADALRFTALGTADIHCQGDTAVRKVVLGEHQITRG